MMITPKITTPIDEIKKDIPLEIYNLKMKVNSLEIMVDALIKQNEVLTEAIQIIREGLEKTKDVAVAQSKVETLEAIRDVIFK